MNAFVQRTVRLCVPAEQERAVYLTKPNKKIFKELAHCSERFNQWNRNFTTLLLALLHCLFMDLN